MTVGRNTVKDIRNFGPMDVTGVMRKSSNVGVVKMALSMPPKTLWSMLSAVGFGSTTGSGFPGEVAGLLVNHPRWRDIELATLAFGYGMSVTPLQLAEAYSVIANDGLLRPVSFLQQEQVPAGQRVMSARVAREVRTMMEEVLGPEGTAPLARVTGYRVAGKTGTVKKAVAGGYAEKRYQALFAGIAPASQPRLAMVVVIDEPSRDVYYGGAVAAPVFSRVMTGALRLMNIPPDDIAPPLQASRERRPS
jgi:cell division protein FtsI (penicillin-binding protein 3)